MGTRTQITRVYPDTRTRDADMQAMLNHGWQIRHIRPTTVIYEGQSDQYAPESPRASRFSWRAGLILVGILLTLFVLTNEETTEQAPNPTATAMSTAVLGAPISPSSDPTATSSTEGGATLVTPSPTASPMPPTPVPTTMVIVVPLTATPRLTAAPTVTPTPTMVVSSAGVTPDDEYKGYLEQKYRSIGGYTMGFERITITDLGSSTHVSFYIDRPTSTYLSDNIDRATMQEWGKALLGDLREHWPTRTVFGSLIWAVYSDTISENSDCVRQSTSYSSGRGWYTSYSHVRASYSPASSLGESIKVCFAKKE